MEIVAYTPDWIAPPHSDPSFYIASSVSMFFDLLLLPIALLDLLLASYFLIINLRRPSSSSDAPSSPFYGDERTQVERSNLIKKIGNYAFKHSVFRKKEWVTIQVCRSSLRWTPVRFEPKLLAFIRGSLATITLMSLITYGLEVAIRQPVAERAKGPSTRSGQLSNTTDTYFRAGFLDNMAFLVGVRSKLQMYRNELTLYYDLVPKEFRHDSVGHPE